MACPNCGTTNEPGRKFCGECGTRLAAPCPSCGTPNAPGVRFCGECGTALTATAPAAAPRAAPVAPPVDRSTERRVVSVLFADLVGFTARSDGQDPESVREFLARYFELARETVERYGGTVEKFIGDAVMAVWGTPIAQEDDPERAVRAAMDLVDGVRSLGRDAGDDGLELRAGVLTGEAAVTVGATGQGMVAGDLVNTASRLQSVAPPGAVLVGDATYRAARQAIVFEAVDAQSLKGKTAPVAAWRALRVVAERGGLGRSEGIEPPFVGRDDELRLLKEVLHATSRERRIRLVSVTGMAGVGKSRLAWEFLKYVDGVLETIYWHQGRSPAIADGVTFWAVGEMVRRRAKLREDADEATTRAGINEMLREYVPDAEDRERLEPVLLSLLGVGGPRAGGRDELFAALRTLFERIAGRGATVLVFEDLQWADAGVLDFIDYMLDWSIGYPILVVTLSRPELLERRPDWGAGRRNLVALSLGPLPEAAMRQLLTGLVPDLPESTLRAVLGRADGIPLYAVEMIRMLSADGRLREGEGRYEVAGPLGDLAIPETLHSLIAARLDSLDAADRALLQDGAVLGQTFSLRALAALTEGNEESLEPRLRDLVRREVLQLDTDPRSPERGQFGFTQALVREVAYGTLSRRDRRARHLAAARHYESLGDEETAGVLATHYVDAWTAAPEGPEGEAVAAQARIALRAAAERAESLGSHEQAVALLERASAVTSDPGERTELLERIGVANMNRGRYEDAIANLTQAIAEHRSRSNRRGAAHATAALATAFGAAARGEDALRLLQPAVEEFADMSGDAVHVELRSALSRALAASEDIEALRVADSAIADAERLDLVPIVAEALTTKGLVMAWNGRWREGTALLEASYRLALSEGLYFAAGRAAVNLTGALIETDPTAAVRVGREGIALSRRYGFPGILLVTLVNAVEASIPLGDLEWIEPEMRDLRLESIDRADQVALLTAQLEIGALRGADIAELKRDLGALHETSTDVGQLSSTEYGLALVALAEARFDDVIRHGLRAAELTALNAPFGVAIALAAAIRLRDAEQARRLLDRALSGGARGAGHAAEMARFGAAVAALEGRWGDSVAAYAEAWRLLRDRKLRLSLALSQLEYLAVAPPHDPAAPQIAAEARELLESIGALAFLPQLDELIAERDGATAVTAQAVAAATTG